MPDNQDGTGKEGTSGTPSPLEKLQQEIAAFREESTKREQLNADRYKNLQSAYNKRDSEIRSLREQLTKGGSIKSKESANVDPFLTDDDPYVQHTKREVGRIEDRLKARELREDRLKRKLALIEFRQDTKDADAWLKKIEAKLDDDEQFAAQHSYQDPEDGGVDYGRSLKSAYQAMKLAHYEALETESAKKREEEARQRRKDASSIAVISGDDASGEAPVEDLMNMTPEDMEKKFPEMFDKDSPPLPPIGRDAFGK